MSFCQGKKFFVWTRVLPVDGAVMLFAQTNACLDEADATERYKRGNTGYRMAGENISP